MMEAPVAVETAGEENVVRLGERVTDQYAPEPPVIDEAAVEPQPTEPQPTEPEQSPDYQAGFQDALEQLAEYDNYEAELQQREAELQQRGALYDQLGAIVGLPGQQVQQLLEDHVRQQMFAAQQQQVESAELQQRMAALHDERMAVLENAFVRLEADVGTFDPNDALSMTQELAQEFPDAHPQTLLMAAAEASARQIAEGDVKVGKALARVNRHVGADPDALRRAADRAFDPSAENQRAAVADAIRDAFAIVDKPVKIGTRVVDRYAELSQVDREFGNQATPPRQDRRVDLRLRDQAGRFTSAERVTDRYRREAIEADQEQRRLAAHQNLMRSKGLL